MIGVCKRPEGSTKTERGLREEEAEAETGAMRPWPAEHQSHQQPAEAGERPGRLRPPCPQKEQRTRVEGERTTVGGVRIQSDLPHSRPDAGQKS